MLNCQSTYLMGRWLEDGASDTNDQAGPRPDGWRVDVRTLVVDGGAISPVSCWVSAASAAAMLAGLMLGRGSKG